MVFGAGSCVFNCWYTKNMRNRHQKFQESFLKVKTCLVAVYPLIKSMLQQFVIIEIFEPVHLG